MLSCLLEITLVQLLHLKSLISSAQVVSLCRGLGSVRYRHSPVLAFHYRVKIMLDGSLLQTETLGYFEATGKVQQMRSLRRN